ncbi:MAG: MFS transporter [Deltaproteobacteria bacterium]|uniref:MFS transporter n=1 Tax=Candidatus Zymogenus saltonus TaxID=2844893 RepID=A0A9D8KHK6_9DELT|nr:MFS transporter [Candidatus Zymogenus saltonus]
MSPLTKPFPGEKLPWYYKFFFGLGDFLGGGSFVLIGVYYTIFLTDVVYLGFIFITLNMVIAKVWDAITDPLMGILSDKTKSRWGRRRVYFIIAILPVAISFFLMWLPLKVGENQENQIGIFIYFLVTHLFFRTVFTMVMIPFNAIIPELTTDYDERSSISGYRGVFSIFSSLLSAALPGLIVAKFTDAGTGHAVMAGIFGLFYALPFISSFFFSYERPEYQRSKPLPFWESFKESSRNRSFLYLLGLYIFAFVAFDILMATFLYFLKYYLGRESMGSALLGTLLFVEMIFLPVYIVIANRTSKKTSMTIGLIIWGVAMSTAWFFPADIPNTFLYAYAFVVGMGTSAVAILPWAMLPDISDVDELMTGKRREGVYAGFFTFIRKISSGLALAAIPLCLGFADYDGKLDVQGEEAVKMIRILFSIVPILFIIVTVYFTTKFPLNSHTHAVCMNEIRRRKGDDYDDMGLSEEEKERILTALTGSPDRWKGKA